MSHNNAVSNDSVVSHQSVCDVMAALLRAAALKHTDEQLAALTGVSARTIKSYRIEGKEPSFSNALSIAVVLGQPAVTALMSLIRYSVSPLDQAEESAPMLAVADAMKNLSIIAHAAADNRIDHTETPITMEAADSIIALMMQFSSHGKN